MSTVISDEYYDDMIKSSMLCEWVSFCPVHCTVPCVVQLSLLVVVCAFDVVQQIELVETWWHVCSQLSPSSRTCRPWQCPTPLDSSARYYGDVVVESDADCKWLLLLMCRCERTWRLRQLRRCQVMLLTLQCTASLVTWPSTCAMSLIVEESRYHSLNWLHSRVFLITSVMALMWLTACVADMWPITRCWSRQRRWQPITTRRCTVTITTERCRQPTVKTRDYSQALAAFMTNVSYWSFFVSFCLLTDLSSWFVSRGTVRPRPLHATSHIYVCRFRPSIISSSCCCSLSKKLIN